MHYRLFWNWPHWAYPLRNGISFFFWVEPELPSPIDGHVSITGCIAFFVRHGRDEASDSKDLLGLHVSICEDAFRRNKNRGITPPIFQAKVGYLIQAPHVGLKWYTIHTFWPRWEITVILNQNETGWGEQTHIKQAEKSSPSLWESENLLSYPDQGCSCGLLVSWLESFAVTKKRNPKASSA